MKNVDLNPTAPDLPALAREHGLLAPGRRTLVMLSGGGDSTALLAVAERVLASGEIAALHVNYGLRGADSKADEAHCRELCHRLGVELTVEHVALDAAATGNLHDRAREARYRLARETATRLDCELIAVAHNADDRAETLLYRLAASPGRRALLGMPRRRGAIVRPLLDFTGAQLRAWCRAEGLTWREDAANVDPRFARTHVRRALDELRVAHPAAVANILRTADELAAEAEVLDMLAGELLTAATVPGGLDVAALAPAAESVAALTLREFVERSLGRPVPGARRALAGVRAAAASGSHVVDVEGARLLVEYGVLSAWPAGTELDARDASAVPPQVDLPVPGAVSFGEWRIAAAAAPGDAAAPPPASASALTLVLPPALARGLTVRARRPGDRLRPRGMGGVKSLQDLFVDRKLPRRLRGEYPLICIDAGARILWVPGLAVDELCPATGADGPSGSPPITSAVTITATRAAGRAEGTVPAAR